MLFRLYEHYDDQPIIQDNYNNECFICFELTTTCENKIINLKNQTLYHKKCICGGSVHKNCLKLWFDNNKSCPICRVKTTQNNYTTIVIHTYIPYGIHLYIFIKNITYKLLNLILFGLFLYTIVDFYLIILKIRNQQYYDYTYKPIPILDNKYFQYFNLSNITEHPMCHN